MNGVWCRGIRSREEGYDRLEQYPYTNDIVTVWEQALEGHEPRGIRIDACHSRYRNGVDCRGESRSVGNCAD